MTALFHLTPAETPVLVSVPHAGTFVPTAIRDRFTDAAIPLHDTDWFVDRLYDFAPAMGIGLLTATHSRYVIDLNRDPRGVPLYAGASNTELVPITTFDHQPIYRQGAAPDEAEIQARIAQYWQPYHSSLAAELERLRQRFGVAVLWDAHSIPSRVPRFFEGRLPDFNFGSAHGSSADRRLVETAMRPVLATARLSSVLDARFVGGYITRTFGQPATGIHALQLEMTWSTYMAESAPYIYAEATARDTREVLRACLAATLQWALAAGRTPARETVVRSAS